MSEPCKCDWDAGECQGPLGCQAVAENLRQRAEIERLTKDRDQVKRLAEAAVEQNNKCTAEVERLRNRLEAIVALRNATHATLSVQRAG